MSFDVNATFASNGYINFYMDEPFNLPCMPKRFDKSTGIYKENIDDRIIM